MVIAAFLYNISAPVLCVAQNMLNKLRVSKGDAIYLLVYDGPFTLGKNNIIANFHDKEFIVDGFGNVRLSFLGEIPVVGQTADQISELITAKLKLYAEEPIVIVEPRIRITLLGEFARPGMYRFSPSISFWQMVEEAGGLLGLASLENMYIMRRDEIFYEDFIEALHKASSLSELGIESGDEIIAPRINRLTFFTVMRYAQFGMSIIIFYLTLLNYRARYR